MNVQTSTLDGFTPLSIPPDTQPNTYPQTAAPAGSSGWSLPINNDSPAENGPYTPQMAMAASINTAYATLWHAVAGPGGMNVLDMAQAVGVDIQDPVSGMYKSRDEATLALGQASLTVGEQASMLATIADNGVYHDPHLITSITQANGQIPVKITSRQVFSNDPVQNAEMDSQVQYAMSEDTNPAYGTAPVAAMSDGQEIIAKTGTTNTAQSAFFEGSIPSQTLVVALFTHDQNGAKNDPQTLNLLGGQSQGGYGGFWPATIWHTYAENMFVPLGVEKFQPVVFTGQKWNEVPPNLRNVGQKKPKKKKKKDNNNQNPNPGNGNGNGNGGNGGNGNPNPYPTYTCDPSVVTCNPNGNGAAQSVGATEMGAALGGGLFAGLPAACLWARRRTRRRPAKRG
jgi:membrane peptidoglycan carboxypeptidase